MINQQFCEATVDLTFNLTFLKFLGYLANARVASILSVIYFVSNTFAEIDFHLNFLILHEIQLLHRL